MPKFNELSGKTLTLFSSGNFQLILVLTAVTVLTGLIAGSYPALFLSAFRPIKIMKGDLKSGAKSSLFRKILVVIQFTLSIFLIIGTAVIYNQISFMQNKKLGFEKEHLLFINLRGETAQSYAAFKEELLRDTRILGVSASMQAPFNNSANGGGADWDGKDPDLNPLIGGNLVDFDFVETMKIEMAEGRSFSKDFPSDTSGAFLVNEEVAKIMGKESVVGERFSHFGVDGTIIGVIKNYHFRSVRNVIEPHILLITDSNIMFALIRIQSDDIKSSMAYVEKSWNKTVPGYPFNYTFFDDTFDAMFRTEERIGGLLKYFSILAVVIACLGLFGLASFTAEQRTKEIGIRKTLGATVSGLSVFICKEFVILVMISNVVAWPAAYYILKWWLEDFAYRTTIGWTIFAYAGVLAFIIAILTVSYQAIKAARANPVDSLKYE
jgi:ABC-type antimicrobial peptide transport system permease subunit